MNCPINMHQPAQAKHYQKQIHGKASGTQLEQSIIHTGKFSWELQFFSNFVKILTPTCR